MYNRRNPGLPKKTQMDKLSEMQQELNETILKIKILFEKATPASYDGSKLPKHFTGDDPLHPTNLKPVLSYNELRGLIESATSSTELHKAWKEVEKNKTLAGWQIRELEKLKNIQQTKIDF